MYKGSYVEANGKRGTYTTELGGVGLAYEVEGSVVKSGGNGFYYPVDRMATFVPDNGDGYMASVRRMFGR